VIDLESVRSDFPALADGANFDNGTVSLTPAPVAAALEQMGREILNHGPPHVLRPQEEYPRREATLTRIAGFLGTRRDQIALVRGVSEAFQTVLRGLTWQPGDEIVITEDEEAALLLPVLHLRDRVGVRVVKLPFAAAVANPRQTLSDLLTDRTRLVALSHVTTSAGYRYPVEALCETARSRGIPSFVDVAHAAGVVPVSLDAMGCDFAGVVSYKWMYGPYAAGALYVRPESIEKIELRYAGNRSELWLDHESDAFGLRNDARRFEYGPFAWPVVHAWAAALDYLDNIGRDNILFRTHSLVAALRNGLSGVEGVEVLTPPPETAGALVTFTVAGVAAEDVRTRLLDEYHVRIKALPDDRHLRASLALFISDAEVEILIDAIGRIAETARHSNPA
jgi:cysteine desulfurase / selenocysteine lyase